jgi:hypothetical protein
MKNHTQQQWNSSRHEMQLAQKIESHRRDLRLASECRLPEQDNIRLEVADLISGSLQPAARVRWPNIDNLTIQEKA